MALPKPADIATLAFTFFAVGMTVSVAMVDRGVSTGVTITAAIVVYSATGELAYLAVRDAGGSMLAAVASGWLVASRFGLLAASLNRVLEGSRAERAVAAFTALDPSVAVAIQQPSKAESKRAYWVVSLTLLAGFWAGSLVGLFLGNILGDTSRLGFDAVFPAALLSIIGNLLRRKEGLVAGVTGAIACIALIPVAPGGVPILASSLGAVVGAMWIARSKAAGS
ncbi:MAG: AzlC family ABC transporter permease [Acidimicrobiales bacterium]